MKKLPKDADYQNFSPNSHLKLCLLTNNKSIRKLCTFRNISSSHSVRKPKNAKRITKYSAAEAHKTFLSSFLSWDRNNSSRGTEIILTFP